MTDDRILSPNEQTADEQGQPTLRPLLLQEFTGQKALKQNLTVFIQAAKNRSESLDHVLLYGPPGLGKTTLAQIIAHELGVGFRTTSGPIISRAGDLAAILTSLQPHDVLFIDEIHRLSAVVEEVLYPAMEDRKLDLMIGEGPSARSVQIDLPPFTLVGATTRSGLITRPLRERFGIPLPLSFYEPDELAHIITRAAQKMDCALTEAAALELGRRSRGTPRVALRILKRVRDMASVWGEDTITQEVAEKALTALEVDGEGFDAADRRYLQIMADHYEGGPVGVDTMAAVLSEQRDVLEEVVEPYLIQKGFIHRTPRGRVLTKTAFLFLGLTPPEGSAPTTVAEDEEA